MDEALVQNPENDIDRAQSGCDQEWLIGERGLKGLRCAGKAGVDRGRHSGLQLGVVDFIYSVAESDARRQIERDCHGRKNTRVIHRNSGGGGLEMCERSQWDLTAAGRV